MHPMLGTHHSEATKLKISQSKIGRFTGESNPFFGRHHTEEFKVRASLDRSARYKGQGNPFYGKKMSQESKDKIRRAAISRNADPEYRKKISDATRKAITQEVRNRLSDAGKNRTDEWRKRKSEEQKSLWANNPEFVQRMRRGRVTTPNISESRLWSILNELYPGEWKYTGDFSFIVNGKSPDFVNCNGKKLIIELFGEYWHRGQKPEDRASIFEPFGYRTLIVWSNELRKPENLKEKIRMFCHE